jgi:[acyl-carrier-protein] S-malonyltransferase
MEPKLEKVAYVFPGQGAQYVGMGHDLYQTYDSAMAVFKQADEKLGFSLSQLCFNGPDDELRKTNNAQPAIVAVSLAILSIINDLESAISLPIPTFIAGHSLGEYTALAAAGVIDFTTTVQLAHERGRLMHRVGQENPGGMIAIIGLDEEILTEICSQTDTSIANINCPGQLVISGELDNLNKVSELAEAKGAHRIIILQVSGAFHTQYMQSVADRLSEIISIIPFHTPEIPIVANTTATEITTSEMVKKELLSQLCNTVHWQKSIEYMIGNGVSTFIEIGPGKVLSGLIKRINRSVKTLSISNTDDINNIMALC